MFLWAQGVDNNNNIVDRVRRGRGISNDEGGVRRGIGIDDTSEGLETTAEAARI